MIKERGIRDGVLALQDIPCLSRLRGPHVCQKKKVVQATLRCHLQHAFRFGILSPYQPILFHWPFRFTSVQNSSQLCQYLHAEQLFLIANWHISSVYIAHIKYEQLLRMSVCMQIPTVGFLFPYSRQVPALAGWRSGVAAAPVGCQTQACAWQGPAQFP